MSSSSEDDVILLWWQLRRMRKNRKKRRVWVNALLTSPEDRGSSVCSKELSQHPIEFKNCYRMSPRNFQTLLDLVSPQIRKKDTNCREAISPTERLLITLRYLTTGGSFSALSRVFTRGNNTIGKIVNECTAAIWQCLRPVYMAAPTEETWTGVARSYYESCGLPNCLGSVDGKHFRINKFYDTGTEVVKGFCSVVLLACADTDGIFTTIYVGDVGGDGDGTALESSFLAELLVNNDLGIPKPAAMPNDTYEFPFYFVGDRAFPLERNLMRPYHQNALDDDRRAFNYTLSRALQNIQCALGALLLKFTVLQKPILCQEKTAVSVIKAACVLHNFIKATDGAVSIPRAAKENDRSSEELVTYDLDMPARDLRDYLKSYLLRPENTVPCHQEVYAV